MTLDTRVYITDWIGPEEVFRKAQQLIAQWDNAGRRAEEQRSEECEWGDHRVWMNGGMQGLPGWLVVHYRPAGQRRTEDEAQAHDHCNPDCDASTHAPACWVEVSLDTAYSYRGPDGINCGQLHALFVAELGMWLDERQVGWRWLNEYTGEHHEGYDRLDELAGSSDGAQAWVRNTVLPAIANMAKGEGE